MGMTSKELFELSKLLKDSNTNRYPTFADAVQFQDAQNYVGAGLVPRADRAKIYSDAELQAHLAGAAAGIVAGGNVPLDYNNATVVAVAEGAPSPASRSLALGMVILESALA